MDRTANKLLKNKYKEQNQKEFESSLPISRELFESLFDFLDEQLE